MIPARNALFSAGQVAISTVVAFTTYAIVSRELGIELLGLWSVTMAICAFVSVADVGVGGSMVRFIAIYRSTGDFSRARTTAVTALGFVIFSTVVVALLGYLLATEIIHRVVPVHEQGIAQTLLPFAMVAAALNSVAETVLGGLEGCERYRLRASAVVFGSITLVTVIVTTLSTLHLLALGMAFVAQSAIVLACGSFFLARTLDIRTDSLPEIQLQELRPLLAMGWRLKIMGLFNLLLDPVTKILVLRTGGSDMSGLFEMAARLPAQLRALLIAGMQVTVPRFAGIGTDDRLALYRRLSSLAVLAAAMAFTTLVLALPLLASLLLGRMDSSFLLMAALISMAWFVNVQSAPAYFAFMGTGEIRWNVLGHVAMGLLNGALGYFGGVLAGTVGVVVGMCIAICCGSSLPVVAFGVQHRVWPMPYRASDWIAVLGCVVIVALWEFGLMSVTHEARRAVISGFAATGFGLAALIFILRHPVMIDIRGGAPRLTN